MLFDLRGNLPHYKYDILPLLKYLINRPGVAGALLQAPSSSTDSLKGKLGDILGSYTCYKNNGQSTVDFCCVSPNIWSIVSTFVINELYPDLSDHCSITMTLKTNL